ncbi:MAG: TolC family protein [Chitinophagaceae bacterium]
MDKNKTKFVAALTPFILAILMAVPNIQSAQTPTHLTIDEVYKLAMTNYPLVKQMSLTEKSKQYSIENAAKGYLPQFSINGQGTYQSEVTSIDIPNIKTPVLSKDQYRIFGELYQSFTDAAIIKEQKDVIKNTAETERQKIEVTLYTLKERINQIYFAILTIDAQIEQTVVLKKDIQSGIDRTNAAISNGTALKRNADNLLAELLKVDQRTIELKSNRKGYSDMLALFIGKPVNESTRLVSPVIQNVSPVINRPEMILFVAQKRQYAIQNRLISARNLPKVGMFFQGGYGRPALNQLSNDFSAYYIGGLRLNWNFGGLYTAKTDRNLLTINQQNIDVQKDVFIFNTNLSLLQLNSEVDKLQQLINTDNEIIRLRDKVKQTAKSQLENGTITTNDYLSYVNAEHLARLDLLLHQVHLSLALYNYQTIAGN